MAAHTPEHYRYRIGRSAYNVLVAADADGKIGVATMRMRGRRADMSGLYVLTPNEGIGTALTRQPRRVRARIRLA